MMTETTRKPPREILGNYLALAGILLILASASGIFVALPFIGWPSLAVGTGMFLVAGFVRPRDADGPATADAPEPTSHVTPSQPETQQITTRQITISDPGGAHLPLIATFLEADPRAITLRTETSDQGPTLIAECAPEHVDDVIYSVSTMIRSEHGEQAALDVTIQSR